MMPGKNEVVQTCRACWKDIRTDSHGPSLANIKTILALLTKEKDIVIVQRSERHCLKQVIKLASLIMGQNVMCLWM